MRQYAVEYDTLPPVGKRAIRNGSASITRQVQFGEDVDPLIDEHQRLGDRNGTFYRIARYPSEQQRLFPSWVLTLLRVGGVGGGAVIAFIGASRHIRVADERGSGDHGRRRNR